MRAETDEGRPDEPIPTIRLIISKQLISDSAQGVFSILSYLLATVAMI